MKQGDNFFLYLLIQVDQEIPATDQIQPGEGRVGGDVLRSEDDLLTYILDDLVMTVPTLEEPFQPFLWDVSTQIFL
ncbi:MAG TPA: hypothetical protein VMT12_07515 [Syntrophales bacterium]|nr:hypothetical protein [Syntrophales bacterium]